MRPGWLSCPLLMAAPCIIPLLNASLACHPSRGVGGGPGGVWGFRGLYCPAWLATCLPAQHLNGSQSLTACEADCPSCAQTLVNLRHNGCLATAPLLLCIGFLPVLWSGFIVWRGPVHAHDVLPRDEE